MNAQCGGDLGDFFEIRYLFHHHHRIFPEFRGQHRPFEIAPVFDSVADQQCIRMNRQSKGRGQFRFGSHFETIFIAMTRRHKPFHDASLLIHLHRENTPMARSVVIFRNGVAKCFVQLFDLRVQYLGKAQQKRRSDFSLKQRLNQRNDFDAHQRISGGMHGQTALFADAEVSSAPVFNSINAVRNFAGREAEALG